MVVSFESIGPDADIPWIALSVGNSAESQSTNTISWKQLNPDTRAPENV